MITSAARHANLTRAGRSRRIIAAGAAFVAAGTALCACSSSSDSASHSQSLSDAALPAKAASGQLSVPRGAATPRNATEIGAVVSPASPLIVRTGSLTLQLTPGSVTRVFDHVSAQANALEGFVSSSATTGATTASLVLRVPSNEFSKLVDEITGDGHTLSEQLNGQDVTGETINLRARITNLTAEESSLRSLMSRAGSISAILGVQDQLFTVEGEIEQLTAQEGSLVDQATFATLDVALRSTAPLPPPPRQGAMGRAVSLAGRNTVAVVRGIVLALGWVFPVAVVALVGGGVLWLRRRRRISGTDTGTSAGPAPAAP